MRNKVDFVESISNEADVICFTETHLDEIIKNEDIIIEGYNRDPYRKDRNSSGGGIIIYISKFIQAKPRPDLDFDSEALWFEIYFPSHKLLLCVVYRQPSNNNIFWDKFHESIENALSYSLNVVITGDVNVDFLTDYSHKIFDIMRLNGLKNVINEPTRFCATRQSLLDPILVSDSCDVYDSHVIQIDRTYSDHDGTIVFLNNLTRSKNNTTYKRMIWDYRNADFDKCNELIATFDWESIINAENSMDQNYFIQTTPQCYYKTTPAYTFLIQLNRFHPNFTSVILQDSSCFHTTDATEQILAKLPASAIAGLSMLTHF
ncbi:unnamed protein product [Mytilus coruscus]|uniref:Endonuclease/exonuclease/phosphatase domain-containing protein n=1 Tax=Mytilus coruscus TaxID=42192 RepID=A0A6J8DME5_MYTCO|nr:unnamed protein product [Mytilus coruscus]